ncbi:MAG: hypothetical protein JWN44_4968 [Myxococcales bacterium]|nr:hypothetical protein [Myxococcales bacterium]
MPAIVNDHDKLHETVIRATLAAGAAAVAGLFVPASAAAALMALAIGCAVVLPTSLPSLASAIVWAIAAAAGGRIGGGVGNAITAAAIGGALARGLTGTSAKLAAALLGTAGAMTASLIGRAFALTDALAVLPTGIETMITGATSGLVIGVSSIGRHLAVTHEPLEAELRALADQSELGQLLGRAAVAYREAVVAIGGEAPVARAAADDLVNQMTRFGKRWRELEAEASRSLPEDLKQRLMLVGRRLEASKDPLARVELSRAREAMSAQLAYLEEIHNGRERAVARLEHQVATLERLRLAALRLRSADAARMGAELQPVVDELAQAGGDFDLASEALTEAMTESATALPSVSPSPALPSSEPAVVELPALTSGRN